MVNVTSLPVAVSLTYTCTSLVRVFAQPSPTIHFVNVIYSLCIHAFLFMRFATFVRYLFSWGDTWEKQTDGCFVPWFCQGFGHSWPLHSNWKAKMVRCHGSTVRFIPDYLRTDHRELWMTAQPLSVYGSLLVYPRVVLFVIFIKDLSVTASCLLPCIHS